MRKAIPLALSYLASLACGDHLIHWSADCLHSVSEPPGRSRVTCGIRWQACGPQN